MTDREFVSTTGTQHRLLVFRFNGATMTVCDQVADPSNPVVQQPARKCKRCYPKGRPE